MMSTICGLVLVSYGLPSVLNVFGIAFPTLFTFTGIFELLVIMLSALWLAIDGWSEEHILKTISLTVAAILAIYFAVDVINMLKLLSIPVPAFLEIIKGWLYFVGGVLLFIGIWAYN